MSHNAQLLKQALREFFILKRSRITTERKKKARESLLEDLYPSLSGFSFVLSFSSIRDEIDMREINHILCSEGRLLLPKVEKDRLSVFKVKHLEKDLVKSSWGILEPNPKRCVEVSKPSIQCVLVPALGFDRAKHRLGYGRGHYDKELIELKEAVKIGIGYKEQQVSDALPIEEHDISLDHVLLF